MNPVTFTGQAPDNTPRPLVMARLWIDADKLVVCAIGNDPHKLALIQLNEDKFLPQLRQLLQGKTPKIIVASEGKINFIVENLGPHFCASISRTPQHDENTQLIINQDHFIQGLKLLFP